MSLISSSVGLDMPGCVEHASVIRTGITCKKIPL